MITFQDIAPDGHYPYKWLEEMGARADEIYDRKFKAKYEPLYTGQFLALDVDSERAFLGKTSRDASKAAHCANPEGIPVIIRIGFDTVYRV